MVAAFPFILSVFIDEDQVKATISKQVTSLTHREFSIEGKLGFENLFSNGLSPSIYAKRVSLSNSAWGKAVNVFYADEVSFSFSLRSILKGELQLKSIDLAGAELWLETHTTGQSNLVFTQLPPDSVVEEIELIPGALKPEEQNSLKVGNGVPASLGQTVSWLSILGVNIVDSILHFSSEGREREIVIDRIEMRSYKGVDSSLSLSDAEDVSISDTKREDGFSKAGIEGSFSAILDQTEVSGEIQFDSLPSVLSTGASNVSLNVKSADASASITGRIDDVFSWQGLSLFVNGSVPTPNSFSGLFGFDFSSVPGFDAKWEWQQPRGVDSLRAERVRISSAGFGLKTEIEGRINRFKELDGMMLKVSSSGVLNGNLLPKNMKGSMVRVDLNGHLSSDNGELFFQVLEGFASLKDDSFGNAQLAVEDTAKWFSLENFQALGMSLKIDSIASFGQAFDIDLPEIGAISATADIGITAGVPFLSNIHLINETEDVIIDMGGRLSYAGNLQGQVKLGADIRSREVFRQLFATEEHGVQQLLISGNLFSNFDRTWGESLLVTGSNETSVVTLSGAASRLFPTVIAELDIVGESTMVTALPFLETLPISDKSSMKFKGKLISQGNGDFDITDLHGQIGSAEFSAGFFGAINRVTTSADTNLLFDWEMRSPNELVKIAREDEAYKGNGQHKSVPRSNEWLMDLIPFFPLKGRARLVHQEQGNDQVDNQVLGSSGWRLVEVEAKNIAGDIRLNAKGGFSSLSPLKGELALNIAGVISDHVLATYAKASDDSQSSVLTDLVLDGRLMGNALLSIDELPVRLDDLHLDIQKPESRLDVSGDILSFSPFIPGKLVMAFDANAVDSVVAGDIVNFRRDNPLLGQVVLGQSDGLNTLEIELEIGDSDLSGTVNWSSIEHESGNVSNEIDAKLVSNRLNTESVLASENENTDESRLLSRDKLSLEWLDNLTSTLDWEIRQLSTESLELDRVVIKAKVDSDELVFSGRGYSKQGPLDIKLRLENHDVPKVDLSIIGRDVDVSSLAILDELDIIDSGIFSMEMNVMGQGFSVAQIASVADGNIKFEVHDARIRNEGLNLLGGDLASQFLLTINPFRKEDNYTGVECGVGHFTVEKGVLKGKSGLAMKTDKVTLVGGGTIDLSDESIKILIAPKARKGFGISTSSIAKMIRIGGSLSDPKVEVDPAGIFKTGVALGAAIVSSGLSLVAQGLVDRVRANLDVCETALRYPDRQETRDYNAQARETQRGKK